MSEIQRVVDELRFLLQREVVDQTDKLTALLSDYSTFCHETNARLRTCDLRLKQGLRAEALQLAEIAPNLLDLIATLDFPERPQLLEVVATYFLTPPEPLLLEIASTLNEAYALQEPLLNLLDTHRLLVLGRCSLKQRLPVLRSLAKLDPATHHWDADVREMERSRHSEMETEARTAAVVGDIAVLQSLLMEAQAGDWCEAVPAALVKTIKSRVTQTQRGQARGRLEKLSDELHSAHQALDPDTARSLRDQWNSELRAATLPANDPLKEKVAPVLNWLDGEDQRQELEQAYANAVVALDQAVNNKALSFADLKRLGSEFDRHERPLPDDILDRYQRRLKEQSRFEHERRSRRMLLSLTGGAAVVIALAFLLYLYNQRANERKVIADVRSLIERFELIKARQIVHQHLSPSASQSWRDVDQSLTAAETTEQNRAQEFGEAMAIAGKAPDNAIVLEAIKRAEPLVRTDDERARFHSLSVAYQARENKIIAEREKQFRDQLDRAIESLKVAENSWRDVESIDRDHSARLLTEAGANVRELQSAKRWINEDLKALAKGVETRLAKAQKDLSDVVQKHDLLEKITHAALLLPGAGLSASKPGAFEAALREFVSMFPNDALAHVMKEVVEASPIAAVLAHQQLVGNWKSILPPGDSEGEVETRLSEVRTFLAAYPHCPDRESLLRYQSWLNSVQLRFEDEGDPDNGLKQKLLRLFSGRLVKEGHTLKTVNGQVFYLPEARTEPFGSVASFAYLVDINGATRLSRSLKPSDMLGYKSEPPPQQEIASQLRQEVKGLGVKEWQGVLINTAEKWLKARTVDPHLRHKFVLHTLEYAAEGDLFLEQELAPLLKILDDAEYDRNVAWMDPENQKANDSRKLAETLLSSLPALTPVFNAATKRQAEFERGLLSRKFSIGWLERSSRGEWKCRTKWLPTSHYTLHAVAASDATGTRQWLEIGRVRNQSFTIDPAVARSVGEATVIFASPEDSTSVK